MAQAVIRLHREKKTLPQLVASLKDAHGAARLVLRGDAEKELSHVPQAIASYTAAAAAEPNDLDAPLRLAALAKTPTERVSRYEALVAAHPGELRFALELAELRYAAKDEVGGKRTLREAATRLATAPTAQDQIARRLVEHGDAPGALECRRRAAELEPRNADYALALGDAYRAAGKRPEAVAAIGDSITRGGDSRAAWDRAIDALERASYDEEAAARYADAHKRWPADMPLTRRYAAAIERAAGTKKGPERGAAYKQALALWREVAKKASTPIEKEQASYNQERLDRLMLEKGF